ncbi:MAG: hypothetical protein BWY16_01090 [Candidatus Omnitrophica bacterium ADurb.Bin205]|nr:MAG: hypothetical protein BWY16_01090 [Candidatus Omnitrophica bacterium ADurb.Bin205]
MEKKEFPKKDLGRNLKPDKAAIGKSSWVSDKAFDIIKLVLGIFLLPFVYSSTIAFLRQIAYIDSSLQDYFWFGVIAFIIAYLFVVESGWVYEKGHKLLEVIFGFFQPLVKVAPYLLPVYTIIIFFVYLILNLFINNSRLINYTMFFFGASLIMHLIFSSKAIRSKKGDLLRSNYIFGFSFIYIINLGIFAFFLNVIFNDFSFVKFCNTAYSIASNIFGVIFSQLFKV